MQKLVIRVRNVYSYVDEVPRDTLLELRRCLSVKIPHYQHLPFYDEFEQVAAAVRLYQKEVSEENPSLSQEEVWNRTDEHFKKVSSFYNRLLGMGHDYVRRGESWNGHSYYIYRASSGYKIPSGLLHRIQISMPVEYQDERTSPHGEVNPDYQLQGINFEGERDYQKEAVEAVLSQKRGCLNISIRGGKTPIMAAIAAALPAENVVIFYMDTNLTRQTHEALEKFLGEEVGIFDGHEQRTQRVTILGVQYSMRHFSQVLPLLRKASVILCDEVHHSRAVSYVKLLQNCDAYYRIGLSGTTGGNDSHDAIRIQAYLGPDIHHISTQDLRDRGLVAEAQVYLIYNKKCPNRLPYVTARSSSKYLFQVHYRLGIVENAPRNQLILDLAERLRAQGGVFIIVERIKHGEYLAKKLGCPFVSGQGPHSHRRKEFFEAFDRGEYEILVANKVAGEGVDIERIKYLIWAAGFKGLIKIVQGTGRALTKKSEGENLAYIFDFMDPFSVYLNAHAEKRKAIYRARGDIVKGPYSEEDFRRVMKL